MGTVLDYRQHGTGDRHKRCERAQRAELFGQYCALHAQGLSQRQAAAMLHVPRTTLQAWHTWQETFDACPQVVAFCESGP